MLQVSDQASRLAPHSLEAPLTAARLSASLCRLTLRCSRLVTRRACLPRMSMMVCRGTAGCPGSRSAVSCSTSCIVRKSGRGPAACLFFQAALGAGGLPSCSGHNVLSCWERMGVLSAPTGRSLRRYLGEGLQTCPAAANVSGLRSMSFSSRTADSAAVLWHGHKGHAVVPPAYSVRQAGLSPLLRLAIVLPMAEARVTQSFRSALCRGAHRCCAWPLCCRRIRCRLGLILVPMPEATAPGALLGLNGPRYTLRLGSQAHALHKSATSHEMKSSSSPATHNTLDNSLS